MRGKLTLAYRNKDADVVKIVFNNVDYDTPQQDIIDAATVIGSSVMSCSAGQIDPLEYLYASGTIDTILA